MGIMIVTKEEAKKLIDEAPGDFVIVSKINVATHRSEPNKRIKKVDGKQLVDAAKCISYQNSDFFGILSCNTQGKWEEAEIKHFLHNIIFPQIE